MTTSKNQLSRERLLIAGAALCGTYDEDEVLARVLQGIQSVGFDRIRLYLLSENQRTLIGRAHVGMDETFVGSEWSPPIEFLESSTKGSEPRVFNSTDESADFQGSTPDPDAHESLWMPLVRDGTLLGGLLAHNHISHLSVSEEKLEAISLFTAQAAFVIEAVRLVSESAAKADTLNSVLRVSMKVNSSLDLEQILTSTCQAAVELLGVDHSGFVRFDERFERGYVRAEFPDIGTLGAVIPLSKMPVGREFIDSPRPFIFLDVENEPMLGASREILMARNIRSTLIVPVLGKDNRLLGSFGLDSIGVTRSFADAEIETCRIFADQVALAIENAEIFEEKEQAFEIVRTALVPPTFDRSSNLTGIIQQAVALLGAKSGGIYQYHRERQRLTVIAEVNRQQNIGKTLRVGEGAAGRLVRDDTGFIVVDNYEGWKGKSRIYAQGRSFGAVLEVPLKWKDEIVGVLYVDDAVGRKFTSRDARMLKLLADQAAIVLINAETFAKDAEKLDSLTSLSEATGTIISNLGTLPLDELLTLIAKFATQILRAESCGVFLTPYKGYLSLEASYGHRKGGFQKGKQLRIESGPGTGLTGHIAYRGELFNGHGTELTEHPAVKAANDYHTPSGKCYSILAVPLFKKLGSENQLVGLLRIDNKKNKFDQALPGLAFTAEDEWLLSIFAETIVVAIERSMFIEQIGKQKENWTRFLDSAATGIIANDASGNITLYNKQAESILGYAASEILYTKVDRLYFDPGEARRIGRLLYEDKASKLTNYETFVRGKGDKRIPIRLSATQLFDDTGNSFGSVGYFDRSATEIQALLARANEILAKTENPAEGLQALAEMLVSLIPHTFCRILLFNENKKDLLVRAAHPIPRAGEENKWKLRLTTPLVVAKWRGLDQLLKKGKPEVLQLTNRRFRLNLIRLSRLLGFSGTIQALLVIPLVIENEAIGMIELGELRSQERTSFPKEEVGLIARMAAQVTSLTVMSLYRITNRHKQELEHLHLAAKAITGAFDLTQVLKTIVIEARKMLGAASTAIWSYDSTQEKFVEDEMVADGIPAAEIRRFRRETPRPGRTAYTVLKRGWIAVPDVSSPKLTFIGPTTRDLLQRIKVGSFEGIALKAGDGPVGVLYVNYKGPRSFRQSDRRMLQNFAAYAALALKRARLLDQIKSAKTNLEIVTYLMALGDRDATLRSIINGTSEVLNCDAVTLYVYDYSKKEFYYPPTTTGLRKPRFVEQNKELPRDSIVYRILRRNRPYVADIVPDDELFKGRRFVIDEGIESCAAIPLTAAGQKVGVMFVNYRSHHRFTKEELGSIKLFADQAAAATSNAQLYEQSTKRAEALQGLYSAGRAVTGSLSLEKTLEKITQQALIVGSAIEDPRCFSHVLLRTGDDLYLMAVSSSKGSTLLRRRVRKISLTGQGPNLGIAGRAAKTGIPQNVGDVRSDPNYNQISAAIRSQMSVPLKIGRLVTGVLSIEHPTINAFSQEGLKNVQLLAAQAAIAIENAQRHERLQHLHRAATAMAGAFGLKQVLQTIVQRAIEMLNADSSAIWSYDHIHDQFIADEMVAVGFPETELKRLRKEEPKPGRTAYTVLKQRWVGVANLDDVDFLGTPTRELLQRAHISSFEGIALRVGDEPVGVLYVNYKQRRRFTRKDRIALENFAAYAALSLKGARLLDQVRKTQTAAEAVAYQTTLGDWEASLLSITGATLEVLDSDASVLYVYDSITRKLKHPPTHVGLRNAEESLHGSSIPFNSIVYKMLQQSVPYQVETISDDPLFKNSHFAREEGIDSCVAIPLSTRDEKLGVMFVNYRRHHTFTKEEIKRVQLFSLQASVAISNAQLFDAAQKKSRVLEGLYKAGREITSSLDRKRTLQAITLEALGIVGRAGKRRGSFSHLALRSGNSLRYIASSSKKILTALQEKELVVDLTQKSRRIGIAGRVAKSGVAKNVGNVALDDDYNVLSDEIKSQLSVPLKIGKSVIGVLSIEDPDQNAFSHEDLKNVELLASQAAVAIDHARQFKDLNETKGVVGSLTALAWMGMASNVWRHEVDGYASTMKLALKRLRKQIDNSSLRAAERRAIEQRLQTITHQTYQILKEQFPPPLSDDEGIEQILINDLVDERIKQYRSSGLLPGIRTVLRVTKHDTTVLCSNDWLTRAFNIVLDNAIKAMATSKRKVLTITTKTTDDTVRVIFKDTGRGIPHSIRRKLFRERIKKPSAKGMGMGLLMLQAIVQAYDGEVSINSSSVDGTNVLMTFPHNRMKSHHD